MKRVLLVLALAARAFASDNEITAENVVARMSSRG
jgi:hypothetical protein